ncbi:hypothetical protein EYM_00970 [Ignicoccus islandicus DSM 13165]|uniref:Uncharacterized protein n=1 Tax=Ignicoccus islandicus DSM 13165 TaxID=940295 RepID=A0A0U3FRP9_9CREN|nr:hypothetical protein [Ignicoccus islandicus]ALU12160.1 hypothetical protein EYM_00970 [Ignicoccus islandicus DSM 13165]
MNVDKAFHLISGLLFVSAGIALTLDIKVPLSFDPKLLLGLLLIAIGVSIAFGASLGSALVFGLSLLVLLLSISSLSFPFEFNVKGSTLSSKGNVTNCDGLSVKAILSKMRILSGNSTEYLTEGPSDQVLLNACSLRFCCSNTSLEIGDLKSLDLELVMSSLRGNVNKCLGELRVNSVMSDSSLELEIPSNCNSEIRLESVMGSIKLKVIVPNGTKVKYSLSGALGEAVVETPEGASSIGEFGEGSNEVLIRGKASLGEIRVQIQRK